MKSKQVSNENVFKDMLGKARDTYKAFTDPASAYHKNVTNNWIEQFKDAMWQALMVDIRAGRVTTTPPAEPPPTEPATESSSKYQRLNSILESIIREAGEKTISQWIMDYLKSPSRGSTMAKVFKLYPEADEKFKQLADDIQVNYNKDKNKLAKSLEKLSIVAYSYYRDSYDKTVPSENPTDNPQEQYTQQLVKQISQMTPEYKDDIPKILAALTAQLKTIDPSNPQVQAITKALSSQQPPGYSPTAESKRSRKRV